MTEYPLTDYWQVTKYVCKAHLRTLQEKALYRAFGELEEAKGHGKWFVATFRDIMKASGVHRNSVKRTLESLRQKGLIEVRFGCQVKANGVATEIRRKTLDELKTATCEGDSIAAQFARILNEQPLAGYGQVAWQVLPSGKIQSSKPNFQSVPDEEGKLKPGQRTRSQIVMEAALPHEVQFVRLDIKRAEPTLILHDLGMPTNLDPYRLFMAGKGEKDRQRAKSAVNALAYCKSWVHRSKAMPEALLPYCDALQAKRESVKREADRTGFVTTLTGRKISRQEGKVHAGQIYNARIAGTVADIVNEAGLTLTGFGCRCWPVSDALYVLAPERVDVEGIFKAGMASKGFAGLSIVPRVTDLPSPRVVNRVLAKDSITPFHRDNLSLPRTEALSLSRTA